MDFGAETVAVQNSDCGLRLPVEALLPELTAKNGEDVEVTLTNATQFCTLKMRDLLRPKKQTDAFLFGLHAVVPAPLLKEMGRVLTWQDLDLMIAGREKLDLEDWRMHTTHEGGYNAKSDQVVWFWEIVMSMDDEWRKKLLRFCTGSSAVPSCGFEHLPGYNGGMHKFTLQKFHASVGENADDKYPKTAACFNTLKLPLYSTKEAMRKILEPVVSKWSEGAFSD